MTSTTLRVARTVLAMQQFSCYVTLKEAHKAVCSAMGEEIKPQSVREMLNILADAGLVHRIGGGVGSGSNEKQYCWTGPCDLQEQQEAAAKRVSTPPATTKECVRQIAEARTLPVLEVVPEGAFEFHTIDPASIKWTGPGTAVSLTPDAPPSPPARRGKWKREPLCTIEQAVAAVRECNGNKKAASELLNVSEPTLYKYLKLSGVVFERPAKRNRRDKRKPAVVGMPQRSRMRSRMPAISPPPPPACVVKPAAEPPRPAPEQKPRVHAAEMLAAMHVDALWLLYKSDVDNDEVRNELALRYYNLVKIAASQMAAKLQGTHEPEFFYAPGLHGLFEAMKAFDVDRGLKFQTYAPRRIKGEMQDELRRLDWVPRLVRHGNTKIAKLTQKLNAVPTAEQLAAEYDCDIAAGQRMLDEKVVGTESYNVAQYVTDAGTMIERAGEISDRKAVAPSRRLSDLDDLRAITKGLNQNERLIVILYYWENQTMKEIGEQLLLSESRVSQMHSVLLERMRQRLTDSGRLAC